MTKKTLEKIFEEHVGKVSDRWSIYLNEYDRLFDAFRNKPVRLLEIGIQNGGSLEIWSKYFFHAQKLVGCDINSDCTRLSYEDHRIAVVVGDANSDKAQSAVLGHASAFDIIIDDGSHRSSDVVKSFGMYFPHLTDEGIFIAEDLHCSYWQEFEGGLFNPFSSIAFFKRLADIVNYEHWGIEKDRVNILSGFFSKFGIQIDEETLQHVHSVEFINSMCVIRKGKPERNKIGPRLIAGSVEMVVPGLLALHATSKLAYDQSYNKWTARRLPPEEELPIRIEELAEREAQIAELKRAGSERDGQIANLKQAVMMYQNSRSWRLTKPLRIIGHQIRLLKRVLIFSGRLLSNLNVLKRIIFKAIHIYRRKGLRGLRHHLKLLESDQYVKHKANKWGLSIEFLGQLKTFAYLLLRFKRLWFASDLRRGFSERVLAFLRGETEGARKLAQGSLRLHFDKPRIWLVNIMKDSYVVLGWGVDLEAHLPAKVRIVVNKTVHHPNAIQRQDVQRAFGTECELPLDTGFAFVLMLPVGVHWMRIEVEGVHGSWIPVRRALLLRIPGTSPMVRNPGMEPIRSYTSWIRLEQKRLKAEISDIMRHIDVMLNKPAFTVVIDTRQGVVGLNDTIQSIRKQIYPYCDVLVFKGESPQTVSSLPDDVNTMKETSLSDIRGDFIVFMQSGQRLAINTLYEFACAINQYPDIDLVYGDEDFCTESGSRFDPFRKPGWSPDYLETFNYIGFPACFRAVIGRGCFEKTHLYDFVLRFTELTTKVLHIPKILGHSGVNHRAEATSANSGTLDMEALSERLSRTGRQGVVCEHELHKGCYDIRLNLKRSPLISIVIPTAGKTVSVGARRIDLIQNVIHQIRDRSTYKNIEIIVIDNGDLSPNQKYVLAEAECKRITYSEPIFNIAKKLNLGVSIATGELLLLMNDDIETLTPSWIERMLEHFEKPHVGVVGAKLLYPDKKTQHVGVVHYFGNPDHVRRLFPRNDPGYFFSTCGVRNYSAVTGACTMTPARVYREVGGYSNELAESFNDVDYCFKVRQRGLSVVYAPRVELTHMESQSRIALLDMGELEWFHKRWAAELVSDQFYNDRFLTIASPTFELCINERML